MKTLQEIKDEVAQSYGYENYERYCNGTPLSEVHDDWEFHLKMVDDAAMIYAEQALDRAAELSIYPYNTHESECPCDNRKNILSVKEELK